MHQDYEDGRRRTDEVLLETDELRIRANFNAAPLAGSTLHRAEAAAMRSGDFPPTGQMPMYNTYSTLTNKVMRGCRPVELEMGGGEIINSERRKTGNLFFFPETNFLPSLHGRRDRLVY